MNRNRRTQAFRPSGDMLEGRELLSAMALTPISGGTTAAEISASATAHRSRIVAQGTVKGNYVIQSPPEGTADLPNTIVLDGIGSIKALGRSVPIQVEGSLYSGGFIVPNAIQNGELTATTSLGTVTLAISGRFSRLGPNSKIVANASITGGTGSLQNIRGIGTVTISLGADQGQMNGPATLVIKLRAPVR